MGGRFPTLISSLVATLAVTSCADMSNPVGRARDSDPIADARPSTEPLPEAQAPAAADSGGCTLVARRYDPGRGCYNPEVTLTNVCLFETDPGTTEGTGEIACLIAPDGTRYAIAKGYTECLVDAATRAGWRAKGDTGLCEGDLFLVGPDGGTLTDEACNTTISSGYWTDRLLAPTLDFATNVDAGRGPRDGRVGQCP